MAAMPAAAAAALRVVTTTADLGSLAQEVGGDKVTVVALAKGYQDPHFVDPKPSFILEVSRADLLIAVGRELEIGWLPPLINNSRNAKIQPGAAGYLDASLNVKILEIPTGPDHARHGRRASVRQPALLARAGQRPADRAGDSRQAERAGSRPTRVLRAALRGLRQAPGGGRRSGGTRRWRRTRARRS